MTNRALIMTLVVVVVSAVALCASPLFAQDGKAGDDAATGGWEYLIVQGGTTNLSPSDNRTMRKEPEGFSREAFPLEKNMDKLGAKGWELVAVAGSPGDPIFYFKRRK